MSARGLKRLERTLTRVWVDDYLMTNTLRLKRGITIPFDKRAVTIDAIEQRGFDGTEGSWTFVFPEIGQVRSRLEEHLSNPEVTWKQLLENSCEQMIFACGSKLGAEYYAASHNKNVDNGCALVIEFLHPIERVVVDVRDFLCTVMTLWDRHSIKHFEKQLEVLQTLYGPSIGSYFEAIRKAEDPMRRIAICNFTAFDEQIIQAHHANTKVIAGRHNTIFNSAFGVTGPVLPNQIENIYEVEGFSRPVSDVHLEQFILGEL